MALPQYVEAYGATSAAVARPSARLMRSALVSGAIVISMMVAILFLASGENESIPIEDMVVTPDDKLNKLVTDLAYNSDKMSVKDMEERLEEWRNDPNTILDLPEDARTQVGRKILQHECYPTIPQFKEIQRNSTTPILLNDLSALFPVGLSMQLYLTCFRYFRCWQILIPV
jgi:hypothetical protein